MTSITVTFFFQLSCLLTQQVPGKTDSSPVKARLETGLELLETGRKSASAGDVNRAQIEFAQAMEDILPSVRHLHLKHKVERDETPRAQLGKVLVEDWEKEVTPQEFQLDESTWKVLGLIPADLDLKSTYIKLLTEEVAAFYDPQSKTMHLIREPEPEKADDRKPPSLLELIIGSEKKFDPDESIGVIAHELTHALGDQHFDLKAMMDTVKDDDDASLALSALLEGDATLTMMAVAQEDWQGNRIVAMPAKGMQRLVRWVSPFLPMMGGATARSSPPVMYETLLFPYIHGIVFCTYRTNAGGWAALDAVYKNPPISTEQILHPEKYSGDQADWPKAIDLGQPLLSDQYEFLGTNCIGELTMRTMLNRFGGTKAAAGWDGDTLAIYKSKANSEALAMIWFSTWDSPEDASEFVQSITRYWPQKKIIDEPGQADQPGKLSRLIESGFAEKRGSEVLVIKGFNTQKADKIASQIWNSFKLAPKKFQWKHETQSIK